MRVIALVLICAGLIGLVFGTISFTTKEKVVDIGPIDITKENTHSRTIPTGASIAALAIGGIMLAMGTRSKA